MKFFISFLIVIGIFIGGCSKKESNQEQVVATSTFSLYDITKHIAKDSIKVIHILPFGVDPHSFEPTPKLMANLEKSRLIIYSGAGLEPWIDNFVFKNKAIDMSKFVHLKKLDNHSHHHKHQHLVYDPHYWLDIDNMKIAVNVITDELIKIKPQKKDFYLQNKREYLAQLTRLEDEFNTKLKSCKKNEIIVNHNAFSYLASKYNFFVKSLTGLSPEAQPSAKDIQSILTDIKKEGIDVVFFEHFVSDRTMKSIAKDSGVRLDVLQPLGNITADEAKKNMSYIDIMRDNLTKISKALKCQ